MNTEFAIQQVMKFYNTDRATVIELYHDEVEAVLSLMKQNVIKGADINTDDDGGYRIGTEEGYKEFVKMRNQNK
jgi:hypothetical protein